MTDPRYPSSKEVEQFHRNADTDGSAKAVHHTLGPGQGQAAPGNHTHTGGDSVTLDKLLENVTISGSNRGGSVISKIIAALTGLGATDTSTDDNDKLPTAMASGMTTVSTPTANVSAFVTVTLPAGRFSAPPDITLSPDATAVAQISCGVAFITKTDFRVYVQRTVGSTTTNLHWIAVQM